MLLFGDRPVPISSWHELAGRLRRKFKLLLKYVLSKGAVERPKNKYVNVLCTQIQSNRRRVIGMFLFSFPDGSEEVAA